MNLATRIGQEFKNLRANELEEKLDKTGIAADSALLEGNNSEYFRRYSETVVDSIPTVSSEDIASSSDVPGLVSGELLAGLGSGGAPDLETLDKRYVRTVVGEGYFSVPIPDYEQFLPQPSGVGEIRHGAAVYDSLIPTGTYFEFSFPKMDDNSLMTICVADSLANTAGVGSHIIGTFVMHFNNGLNIYGDQVELEITKAEFDAWLQLGNRVGVEYTPNGLYVHTPQGRVLAHTGYTSDVFLSAFVQGPDDSYVGTLFDSPTIPAAADPTTVALGLNNTPLPAEKSNKKLKLIRVYAEDLVMDASHFEEGLTPYVFFDGYGDHTLTLAPRSAFGSHDEIIVATHSYNGTITILDNIENDGVVGRNTLTGTSTVVLRRVSGITGPSSIDWAPSHSTATRETIIWSGSAETITIPELSSGRYYVYVEYSGLKTKDEFHIPDTVAQGDIWARALQIVWTASGATILEIDQNQTTIGSAVFSSGLAGANLVKITKVEE